MKKFVLIIPVLLLTMTAAAPVMAQGKEVKSAIAEMAETRTGKLNRLMDISGIRIQYSEIPKVIKSAADAPAEPGQEIPQLLRDGIKQAVDDTIIAADLVDAVVAELDKKLTEPEIDDVLEWYESEQAQEITNKEIEASSAESLQNADRDLAALMKDPEIVAKARKIDELTGSSEFALDIQMYTQLAMISAIANVVGPDSGIDIDQIKAQMEQARPMIKMQIQEASIQNLVFTYSDLPKQGLDAYVAFLDKPTTRKFMQIVMASTKTEMESMITAFTQELAKVLRTANQ
ncbi:MAG: DUF2059 domain-containing protein [Candidatus Omnitrophica bacterium]|nr:DUF2059 domain-containing protein [Candidatus Omnitrophota bacterium]